MFRTIFFYRLKRLTRQKEVLFWGLLFPLVLGTLFSLAFAELNNGDHFNTIPVAIVYDDESQDIDQNFESLLRELEKEKPVLVSVTKQTKDEAQQLLEKRKIKGYYTIGEHVELSIAVSGNGQNILGMILKEYNQTAATVETLMGMNKGFDPQMITGILSESNNYLKTETLTKGSTDNVVIYFYALIAMACLYAANNGAMEMIEVQADQSKEAARLACAPVNKTKYFMASVTAIFTVQMAQFFIIMFYLSVVLGVDFGTNYLLICLLGMVGTWVGIFYGTCVGIFMKGDATKKLRFCSLSIVALCFLAGMMVIDMKYIIQTKAPILAALNPATRITDALYSLHYYDSLDRYWSNMAGLCIIGALLVVITLLKFGRQTYESI